MHGCVAEEKSFREVRDKLADVIHTASVYGQITDITNRGRRVAAVVPVPVAETAENQAERG
ncbi:hypothetical protein C3Y87_16695 [Carbonactinospora thermoautotrophica]|uniref:Antitoxin n=1 Tax=Carbonactinospora thermoautotrophica TaxID=1469144 RepID=A0A132NKN8_9ACTN|nr:hypothetical protein TH66_03550 [Carbonactinospora thermoautotrophica]KWX10252.1 hypothetical protein TR74_04745 [Carbonactinospora thermoautotrophica]MCX9193024.1 hypothetical protein [Carbonactinospora thermoautotrophica]